MKQRWIKKLEYIWMYYKIPICTVMGLILVVSHFGYAKISEKECAFNAILFDVHTDRSEETLAREFAAWNDIDTSEYDVQISTSLILEDPLSNYAMTSRSRLYALIGTQDLDAVIMREDDFHTYENADAFCDLRSLFTEEELLAFPSLYKDSEGRVLGVYANSLPLIREIGGYSDSIGIAGIVYNTRHPETAKAYLQYLNQSGKGGELQ